MQTWAYIIATWQNWGMEEKEVNCIVNTIYNEREF